MGRLWTDAEDKYMVAHYADTSTAELKTHLKRSPISVYQRARNLGLCKSKAFIKEHQKDNFKKLSNAGKAYRFPKGHEPANKGLKQTAYMSEEKIERTKPTRFKPGRLPHNTKSGDGHITIRKDKRTGNSYKWIKVSMGKWQLLHRVVWERKHGDIDRKTIVTFKDGDSLNCELSNLTTISMKENRIRNAGWSTLNDNYIASLLAKEGRQVNEDLKEEVEQYPELLELKRNQIKLNRHVKQHRNNQ